MTPSKNEQYSQGYLQKQSYKYLQNIAKSMHLPANIKKDSLAQLIHAKHTGNDADVKEIIEKMKHDREEHFKTPKPSSVSQKTNMTPASTYKTRSSEYKKHYSRKELNSSFTYTPSQLSDSNSSASVTSENRQVSSSNNVTSKPSSVTEKTYMTPPSTYKTRSSEYKRHYSRKEVNSSCTHTPSQLSVSNSSASVTSENRQVSVSSSNNVALRKKSQHFERRLSSEIVEEYFNCMNKGEQNGVNNHSNEITNSDTNDVMTDLDTLYVPDCLPELEIKFESLKETNDDNNQYNSNNKGNPNSIHQINEPNFTMDLSEVNAIFAKFNLNFDDLCQSLPTQSLKDLETVNIPSPNATISSTNENNSFTCNVADAASAHITATDDIEYDTEHSQQLSSSKTIEQILQAMDFTESVEIMETTEFGVNLTFSEKLEDVYEITQHGDMEHTNMVSCIFCNWSESSMIYDSHMRKEHPNEILRQTNNECNISYCLGSIIHQKIWICRVLEIESKLYMLRAKYEDPDCLMIVIYIISCNESQPVTGSITVYNKVTGEPYTWEGQIAHVHSNLLCGLQLELSKLNLIPNSSNLQLLNKELVMLSPSNVVVGQPALNDIFIDIHIKIDKEQDIING